MASTNGSKDSATWEQRLIRRLADAQPQLGVPSSRLTESNELFHYTTAIGLKGIIEDNCIWATAAAYLNDASEIEYGAALLEEVFEEWISANKDNKESWGIQILKNLKMIFNDPESKLERTTGIYVACFCESDNLLSQWRTYGQAGGYSIGFALSGSGLERIGAPRLVGLKAQNIEQRTQLVRVIYKRDKQRERLHRVLREVLPLLDLSDIQDEVISLGKSAMQRMSVISMIMLERFLLEEIAGFKNEAFAEEQEWRIVLRSAPSLPMTPEEKTDSHWLHLRLSRGLMVPFVKIVPIEGKLPIKSVRFGPSLDKTRAEHSVEVLLELNGFPRVKIQGSDIPVVL